MLDPGGNADILVFVKEITKKGDFSRLGQTGSMIMFIKRAGGIAATLPMRFFRVPQKGSFGAGKQDIHFLVIDKKY